MRELYSVELVPGRKYRIEHKQHVFTPRLGRFIISYFNPINTHNDFYRSNNITKSSYGVKEWNFYESAELLISEQVARGLCDSIPEDTAGIIQEFLVGRLGGPRRYPAR